MEWDHSPWNCSLLHPRTCYCCCHSCYLSIWHYCKRNFHSVHSYSLHRRVAGNCWMRHRLHRHQHRRPIHQHRYTNWCSVPMVQPVSSGFPSRTPSPIADSSRTAIPSIDSNTLRSHMRKYIVSDGIESLPTVRIFEESVDVSAHTAGMQERQGHHLASSNEKKMKFDIWIFTKYVLAERKVRSSFIVIHRHDISVIHRCEKEKSLI